VLAALGLLIAGLVKGATGLGYATCALPFLVAAIGLKAAVVIVPIPAMAANIGLIFGVGHGPETLQRFWKLYAAIVPGIFCGTLLLGVVDAQSATRVLGVITIAYVIHATARPDFHLPSPLAKRLEMPVGLLNGFLTGLTGSQIVPLLPYLVSLKLDPDRFVQAVNMSVIIASVILILAQMTTGLMTLPLAVISVLGIAPAALGTYVGNRVRRHIPSERFRTVVLATLFAIGLSFVANLNSFFAAPN
jgi:uncharacterized membrane protein YfcA